MEKTHCAAVRHESSAHVFGEQRARERGAFGCCCCVNTSAKTQALAAAPDGDDVLLKHLHFQQDVSN